MNGRIREWIARARQSVRPSRTDRDIAEELQSHLENAEEELLRQGIAPEEAARMARVQCGGPTQAIEEVRAARGIPGIDSLWLDVKLGARMLRKHWALTLIGGLAMAFSMTLAASLFTYAQSITGTSLPFAEGDRIVVVQRWDPAARASRGASIEDLERWRGLQSVKEIGAFRISSRNLSTPAGLAGPAQIVAMSAGAFAITGVKPLLGRYLLPEDERPDASKVIVIGADVWQSHFASDPAVIGRSLQLDGETFTVIGVMPGSFAFPVRNKYWVSLNRNDRSGLTVFGRLAPGVPMAGAQAEAATVSVAGDDASRLQTRVVPYAIGITGSDGRWLAWIMLVLGALLLLPPCLNIAALIYARTVARQGEFAARAALGANRSRIVAQIFMETLVLTSGSAALAMFLSPRVAEILGSMLAVQRPFWVRFETSYSTFFLSAGLAVFAALIAGALPALRATGRWRLEGLHLLNRSSAPRLGRLWTAMVAAQVAIAVAFVPLVAESTWNAILPQFRSLGFRADQVLTLHLAMPRTSGAAVFVNLRNEVARRLRSEAGVTAVAFSESVPIEEHDALVDIGEAAEKKPSAVNRVDAAFFDALEMQALAGSREVPPGMAVVDQRFVERFFQNGNALGRRVRLPDGGEYQISGIVRGIFPDRNMPVIYLPLDVPGGEAAEEIRLMVRYAGGIPANSEARIREAAALDGRLRVDDFHSLDEVYRLNSISEYVMGIALAGLALCVVLFAVTGIYTLMSFSVEHRRREIGIRSALGASATRLALGAFRRVLIPVGISAAVGGIAAIAIDAFFAAVLFDADPAKRIRWLLPASELFVVLIAVVVLIGPVRRALRVSPAEALRDG